MSPVKNSNISINKAENSAIITEELESKMLIKFEKDNLVQRENFNKELLKAAANGDVKTLERIVKMGLNVNSLLAGNNWALHAAAHNGHLDIIRILLTYEINVEIPDKDGDRPLHHAAFGMQSTVIDLLASMSKVDLNSRNNKHQTALHIAVYKGHLNVINTLIRLGCLINVQDIDDDTPIHYAILKKNEVIVDLLLNHDVALTSCNKNSFNPLHFATLQGNIK